PNPGCLSNGATPRYLSHRNSAQFPTNKCARKHNCSTWNNCDRGYTPQRPEAAVLTANASPNCSTWNNLGGPDAAAPPREAIAWTASHGQSSRYTQRQLNSPLLIHFCSMQFSGDRDWQLGQSAGQVLYG